MFSSWSVSYSVDQCDDHWTSNAFNSTLQYHRSLKLTFRSAQSMLQWEIAIIFNQLYCISKRFCITKVKIRHKCSWNQELLLAGCIINRAGIVSVSDFPTKFASQYDFFAISRQIGVCTTRFWTVPMQANLNLLNKWPLKFACAYLNTQESRSSGTHLKRFLHYNEVFDEIVQSFAIIICFGQVNFSSFSVQLESIYKHCFRT
ncbi:hypothetical protein T07_13278, partial [Trichinella nelsoni]